MGPMLIIFRLWRFLAITVMITGFAVVAAAQLPTGLEMVSFPTGLQPLGMDIAYYLPTNRPLPYVSPAIAVVANSGENSVSLLNIILDAQGGIAIGPTATKITGIPSPYAVAACPSQGYQAVPLQEYVLVSSPSDNSVRVLQIPQGTVVGRVQVGPQPHSVACFQDSSVSSTKLTGIVSNLGDNSLTVFDIPTLAVTATIPNVPASRGLHGISVFPIGITPPNVVALVAGTDSNAVTLVSLVSFRALTQIPVARPTATWCSGEGGSHEHAFVASAGDDEVLVFNSAGLTSPPQIYQNVPNPQDVGFLSTLLFATVGGQDSVAYWPAGATTPSIIPGIPGAAALAAPVVTSCVSVRATTVCLDNLGMLVTSTSSNSVFLIRGQGATPSPPADFQISNGATFGTSQVAAGSLASVFASTGVSQAFFASTLPLPNTLGGVSLSLGGTLNFNATSGWTYSPTGSLPAPLGFVGPTQVNFQIPPGISLGNSVPAQLTRPDGSTLLTTMNVVALSPGIFTFLMNGQGQGAVLNQDYSPNGNPQTMVGAKPAPRGGVIQIYATGAGATNPPMLPGEAAPASGNPLVFTQIQPTVAIGGITSPQVYYSIMAPGYPGLWQIDAQVPQNVTPGFAVPLVITAGGISSNTVTIAVQ